MEQLPDFHDDKLQRYEQDVLLKYQIFNGLFLGLPFADPDQAGARLPIFAKMSEEWIAEGKTAPQIVTDFLALIAVSKERHQGLLFKFIQFIERQVVLFDALEDAAFAEVRNMSGKGSINYLLQQVKELSQTSEQQLHSLLYNYKTRLVLTAHPTQFYPISILAVIGNLIPAIKNNDIQEIRNLFLQMGMTRFGNSKKPTPLEEAGSIIWYLEHIFYPVLPLIQNNLSPHTVNLEIGFWPGGDRDGNPFVTAEVTMQVAAKLRNALHRLYYKDIQKLKNRLTFPNIHEKLTTIAACIRQDSYINHQILIQDLEQVVELLENNYLGLFVNEVRELILKIRLFKFHFAKLDIRQDSSIHLQVVSEILEIQGISNNYLQLDDKSRCELLLETINKPILRNNSAKTSPETWELISTLKTVAMIQKTNGLEAVERYIISNTNSVSSVLEILWLIAQINLSCSDKKLQMQIIPLFETIDDLAHAETIMQILFNTPEYRANLALVDNCQTIMLGFSDGTKDGGYLMANWAIFQAKKRLSTLAANYGISVVFFDGRGGPPSRGGGETYSFYQSLAQEIDDHEIQLTVQGQTISANFGTIPSAKFNLEHLLSAGLNGRLLGNENNTLSPTATALINQLAEYSYQAYQELRNHPRFIDYLEQITPLKYLSEANIGSRPAKRKSSTQLRLEDLRAIPFGGAWMQMKQNILGYYGIGSALKKLIDENQNNVSQLRQLYQSSLLFKGLLDNAMQSLAHTDFSVSRHLQNDEIFGEFWQKIYTEAQLSQHLLLIISGHDKLVAGDQIKHKSIQFREQIVRPLVLIQQYALDKLRHLNNDDPERKVYEKLVSKTLAASINASRNSI